MVLSPFSATWRNDIVRLFSKGIVSATDNAAIRSDGAGGIQSSPVIIADTTGALSRSGNGGIPLQGTNTNDNAAAGYVGEYISSSVVAGSAVSLTTGNAANVTSISLTAGDWDVVANAAFAVSGTTNYTILEGSINTTSATLGDSNDPSAPLVRFVRDAGTPGTQDPSFAVPRARIVISATTTVYLVARSTFSASTVGGYGFISARRVR